MLSTVIQRRRRVQDCLLSEVKNFGYVQGNLGRTFDDGFDLLLFEFQIQKKRGT
jgi:hypothetical protein